MTLVKWLSSRHQYINIEQRPVKWTWSWHKSSEYKEDTSRMNVKQMPIKLDTKYKRQTNEYRHQSNAHKVDKSQMNVDITQLNIDTSQMNIGESRKNVDTRRMCDVETKCEPHPWDDICQTKMLSSTPRLNEQKYTQTVVFTAIRHRVTVKWSSCNASYWSG